MLRIISKGTVIIINMNLDGQNTTPYHNRLVNSLDKSELRSDPISSVVVKGEPE